MDSDSVNKISKASVSLNLNDQSNSKRRKQPKWFITLIIFFILIIVAIISVLTMIKRDYESELPANNPEKAIKSICSPTPYYQTCFNYMSNSLVIDDLQKVSYSLKSSDSSTDQSTVSHCNYLYFNKSLSQLNSYLAIDEEKNMTMRSEMLDWLQTERPKIARCLYSLKLDKGLDTENANNCLMILVNMNSISEMLNPSINFFTSDPFRSSGRSTVALLFSDREFVDTVCIFGVQFIFLLFLVCILLRVW